MLHNSFFLAVIDWLNNNYWWPAILFLAALFFVVKIILIKPQTKPNKSHYSNIDSVIMNFGGVDNIVSISLEGNRLKCTLKEIGLTNLEGFKEIGAKGVFVTGRNVKMILPYDMEDVVRQINSQINGGKQ